MAPQDSSSPDYVFKREFRSSFRLNYNHWMMSQLAGYLLHPSIPQPTGKVRIADIGTGTAIWMLELAEKVPSDVELHGFDISTAQYPPLWPENITLHSEQNAFKSFPDELLGTFDIVHIRFFLLLVQDATAEPLLKNLLTLLKPGGYIQWFEPSPKENSVQVLPKKQFGKTTTTSDAKVSTTFTDILKSRFDCPYEGASNAWLMKMPEYFENQGLKLVASEAHPTKSYLKYLWGQSCLVGTEDSVDKPLPNNATDEQKEQAAQVKAKGMQFLQGLESEFKNGVYLDTTWRCYVGQKPL